eukprot:TRINITY_DN33963_c0_g1_i1.p1 TRINITY_DN33963_c0_g1~~TRINITY_DN33963_c0_g1_i1.p1  ORF type:complete len:197 (-),score=11.27 TRINITY_DN33963_c0_g1_i1:98-688(-)
MTIARETARCGKADTLPFLDLVQSSLQSTGDKQPHWELVRASQVDKVCTDCPRHPSDKSLVGSQYIHHSEPHGTSRTDTVLADWTDRFYSELQLELGPCHAIPRRRPLLRLQCLPGFLPHLKDNTARGSSGSRTPQLQSRVAGAPLHHSPVCLLHTTAPPELFVQAIPLLAPALHEARNKLVLWGKFFLLGPFQCL